MLLKGATIEELFERQKLLISEKGFGRKRENSIHNHINHLKGDKEHEHGLSITDPKKNNGIYKFNYPTTDKEGFEKIEQVKNLYDKLTYTERDSIVSQRIGQDVLRKELLQAYRNKCAMCDVDATEVLRASHIVPWSEDKEIRLEPSNAILLCGLHDLAFDKGLITINYDYSISLPKKPKGLRSVLEKCTYKKLDLPKSNQYHPNPEYLLRHKKLN